MFIRFILISLLFQSLLQVSWVRHRDIHLLTVGRYTYTSDQRFRAIHHPHSEDWILQIKYPQHRDSGIYECQVRDSIPTIIQLKTKFIAHVRWYLATTSCLPVAESNKTTTTISNSLILSLALCVCLPCFYVQCKQCLRCTLYIHNKNVKNSLEIFQNNFNHWWLPKKKNLPATS